MTVFQVTATEFDQEIEIPAAQEGQVLIAKAITRNGRTYTTTYKPDGTWWRHQTLVNDTTGEVLWDGKRSYPAKNMRKELLDSLRYTDDCVINPTDRIEITITAAQ